MKYTEFIDYQIETINRLTDFILNDSEFIGLYNAFEIAVAILCKNYFVTNNLDVKLIINKGKLCENLNLTNQEISNINNCIVTLLLKK